MTIVLIEIILFKKKLPLKDILKMNIYLKTKL
jgi:hypothetical protein